LKKSGFWFFGVAAAAGLTHLAVFFLIERFLPTVLPELTNFLAFCVAFTISFMGHRNLSFSDTTSSVEQSLRRFVLVSMAGFACNEVVFSLALRLLGWPSWLALLVGFAVAGGQTYLLSRYWAFHRK
jgi:putative flippase GtrA